MSVSKQLYQLQEVDLELESNEQALEQITNQLGESQTVITAREKLALEQQHLEELKQQQNSTEWEVDDLTVKLNHVEKELYSGRITNPKELTNLQHEAEGLKVNRNQLEDKLLEIMEQVELTSASVASISSELKTLEDDWHHRQQQLSRDMEQLKALLADLSNKRQLLSAEIDPQAIEIYSDLKRKRGTAVVKVEQGICRGCQLSLPASDMQQVRGGGLVQCSSCGRILFLA
jgi:predicted  nucleic acid-binding Zn-ribbon protein